jgi:heptosyltransferase-1
MTAETPPPPRRALIIKPSALGDVVTAVPVLRGLRRTFPEAHLSWMLSNACAPLLADDADLDEVVHFDRRRLGRAWHSPAAAKALLGLLGELRRGGYDWVIDLQGLFRSGFFARVSGAGVRAGFADAREGAWLFYTHRDRPAEPHTVDRNLSLARLLGVEARREDMTLAVTDEGRRFAEAFRRERGLGGGEFLVFVPPTRWVTKCYPPRHWRAVTQSLGRRMPVAVVGTAADRALCEHVADAGGAAVSLAGQTSIPQMVGLIAAAACVVCSDSAAKFIAPAVGTDVVTLIGPTRLERTGPVLGGRALVADVPCQGCLRRRCGHITCMQTIRPEAVTEAVEQSLAEHR